MIIGDPLPPHGGEFLIMRLRNRQNVGIPLLPLALWTWCSMISQNHTIMSTNILVGKGR
jgi:hypothetical protein